MGEVFRAQDVVLAREVAVKVLHPNLAADPGFVDRFRLEARAAAGLNHPNIVAVHDWGAVDGIYFMIMEFVRGQSLRDVLAEEGLLAPAQAVDVLLQILAALDHAHRTGIVHRDVKPENVMLTREGVAKVADFGLARAYANARATQTGSVTGTAQYLAPEQLVGEPADPRTDLYSLGIVAFELLTGRAPFDGETGMAIAYKHLRERVPRPSARNPGVPPGLDGWVASMTEKDRELRPESASEARRDLAAEAHTIPAARPLGELVRETPPGASSAGGPERAPTVTIPRGKRPRRGRTRRWVLGIVVALLGLSGAAWGAWTYIVPHHVEVPRVTGLSVGVAEARLNDAGLSVTLAAGRHSLSVSINHVIDVRPAPGTVLRRGSAVTLIPSLGPPPVPVPNLIGKTLADAKDVLAKAKLTLGTQKRRFSDAFAVGHIVGQSVPGGGTAPRGSAIDVVVSRGPHPQAVPRVVGKTEQQARRLLSAWVVKTRGRYSPGVPRGLVMEQRPDSTTMLQPGKAVVIVLSLGPKFCPIPNFLGMTRDAAEAAIRELGLVPQVYQVPGSSGDTVQGQLPNHGTTVRAGSTVTIYVA
jgi:beta-lactam-binding protein with PASTA domain